MRADFTSALYLGMRHPSATLEPWTALTWGKPAALAEPPGEAEVARRLAGLMASDSACLFPSSLHLFWDLFGWLATQRFAVLVDGAAYPVARWGAQRAQSGGTPVCLFRHAVPAEAAALAARWRRAGRRPLILADGYTPGDNGPPPLASFAEIAAAHGGMLVVDDTQAMGIVGPDGGGTAALPAMAGAPLLAGASLAKGFGVPLAVLAGAGGPVEEFRQASATRVHCSPPCSAVLAAALHALDINRREGNTLRVALARRITQFRHGLASHGQRCSGGSFPVQRLALPTGKGGPGLLGQLRRRGVDVLLQGTAQRQLLAVLLRADHSTGEVAHAIDTISTLMEVDYV